MDSHRGGRILRVALCALLLGLASFQGAPPRAESGEPAVVAEEGLQVVHWPGHRALAERTLRAAQAPLPLPGLPRDTVFTDGTIYLAPSPALFDSLTGGRAPDWAAGVAFPRLRLIILPVYSSGRTPYRDPVVTLRHELAHLALNAYLPSPIPRWFDEGYATWVSGSLDESSAWRLRLAFLLGRAPPLDSLALGWPAGAGEAELAYLLSASAVRFLAEQGGEQGFAALLDAWRQEGTLEAAIRRVYGITLGQFESDWRRMVRRRYGWLLMFSQITVFWLVAGVVLIGLYVIRRRRNRARLAQLDLEDRMRPPGEDPYADEWMRSPAPEADPLPEPLPAPEEPPPEERPGALPQDDRNLDENPWQR